MKINAAGIQLIKEFEGCELEAYPDPATNGDPWTVGVGHCGPEVKPGMTITEAEAYGFLTSDLEKFEACVESAIEVPMTENQFSACVALAFNIGCKAFKNSTLVQLMNNGNPVAAQQQFRRWNKAAGKEMAGLTRRREAEANLFGAQ